MRHKSGPVFDNFMAYNAVNRAYAKEAVDCYGVTPAEQVERLVKVPLAHRRETPRRGSIRSGH